MIRGFLFLNLLTSRIRAFFYQETSILLRGPLLTQKFLFCQKAPFLSRGPLPIKRPRDNDCRIVKNNFNHLDANKTLAASITSRLMVIASRACNNLITAYDSPYKNLTQHLEKPPCYAVLSHPMLIPHFLFPPFRRSLIGSNPNLEIAELLVPRQR